MSNGFVQKDYEIISGLFPFRLKDVCFNMYSVDILIAWK